MSTAERQSNEPADIVDSMMSKISDDLLNDELSEYASGSNNSASGWHCDNSRITNAYWGGKGKIIFSAEIHFSGTHNMDSSMFGPAQVEATVNGVLEDSQGNYQFQIKSIEVVSIEEEELDFEE